MTRSAAARPPVRRRKAAAPEAPIEVAVPPAPEPAGPLWSHVGICAAVGGATGLNFNAEGVTTDSRKLRPGDVFVALRSERDGHLFVRDAAAAGAVAAVVSWRPRGVARNFPLVFVRNTGTALLHLAQAALYRNPGVTKIAVTGSAGKTSLKDALAAVLAPQGKTHAASASHNNLHGTALTAAGLPHDARYAVFEMGMNHAGEIAQLTELVRPQVAVITGIGPAHIEFFASEADIARAKAEIFLGLPASGVAVLNADDAHYALLRTAALKAGARVMTFGRAVRTDVRILACESDGEASDFTLSFGGQKHSGRLQGVGEHAVYNAAATVAAVIAAGGDPTAALAVLGAHAPSPGRGVQHTLRTHGGEYTLIDDSYNANPMSMRAAARMPVRPGSRRIAVLGDMAELGEKSAELHAGTAAEFTAAGVETVITTGPLFSAAFGVKAIEAADAESAAFAVLSALRPGDTVLVKGSRVSGTDAVVRALLEHGKP